MFSLFYKIVLSVVSSRLHISQIGYTILFISQYTTVKEVKVL